MALAADVASPSMSELFKMHCAGVDVIGLLEAQQTLLDNQQRTLSTLIALRSADIALAREKNVGRNLELALMASQQSSRQAASSQGARRAASSQAAS